MIKLFDTDYIYRHFMSREDYVYEKHDREDFDPAHIDERVISKPVRKFAEYVAELKGEI